MPGSKKKRRGGEGGKGKRRSAAARPKSASPAPYILGGAFCLAGLIVLVTVMSGGSAPAPKQKRPAPQAPQPAPQPPRTPPPRPAPAAKPAPARKPARRAPRPKAPKPPPQARALIEFVDAGFDGSTDLRHHVASCGNCKEPLDERFDTCPYCRAELTWKKDVPCPYCSKKPKVEGVETKKGFCAYCDGTRKNPDYKQARDKLPFGMTRGETKGCPVCVSSGSCRKCQGSGRFTVPDWFGQ